MSDEALRAQMLAEHSEPTVPDGCEAERVRPEQVRRGRAWQRASFERGRADGLV